MYVSHAREAGRRNIQQAANGTFADVAAARSPGAPCMSTDPPLPQPDLLAALMGVLIPISMLRLGRDPAVGSSVMITAVTDSGGFFIFLGLATLLLVRG